MGLKKLFWVLLLVGVATGMTGCATLVKAPVVTVKDFNVVSVDGGGAGMELLLAVTNPNFFEVKLEGYSYDLKVMALPLVKGGAREEIRFPSNTATDVRIPIKISYRDLIEILKRKPDPDKVPYQLAAGLEMDTPMGRMTVPVNRDGTYAIPKQFRPSAFLNRLSGLLGR